MLTYLNFKPTKNTAFRLYLAANGTRTSGDNGGSAEVLYPCPFSGITFTLSKDGSAFSSFTNTPVEVTTGKGYIDLTADEMNADSIHVNLQQLKGAFFGNNASGSPTNSSYGIADSIIIYTTTAVELTPEEIADEVWGSEPRTLTGSGSGVSNFSASFLNFLVDAIQVNYDLVDFSLSEGDYNYYGIRHTNADWLIVRETVADSTLMYAYSENNNGKKYDAAWTNHSALTFASSQSKV